MSNRALLHRDKLEKFYNFCIGEGFKVQRNRSDYEVLMIGGIPGKKPIFVHDRNRGDHFTVSDNGTQLVRKFIDDEYLSDEHEQAKYETIHRINL